MTHQIHKVGNSRWTCPLICFAIQSELGWVGEGGNVPDMFHLKIDLQQREVKKGMLEMIQNRHWKKNINNRQKKGEAIAIFKHLPHVDIKRKSQISWLQSIEVVHFGTSITEGVASSSMKGRSFPRCKLFAIQLAGCKSYQLQLKTESCGENHNIWAYSSAGKIGLGHPGSLWWFPSGQGILFFQQNKEPERGKNVKEKSAYHHGYFPFWSTVSQVT